MTSSATTRKFKAALRLFRVVAEDDMIFYLGTFYAGK